MEYQGEYMSTNASHRSISLLRRQITLIELGPFRTSMLQKGLEIDLHPAYSNPGSVVVKLREMVQASSSPDVPSGDVRKGAAKIFELTLVPNPPMRLLLGKYAVDGTRSQMRSILAEADAYEEWSEDLMQDTNSQVRISGDWLIFPLTILSIKVEV